MGVPCALRSVTCPDLKRVWAIGKEWRHCEARLNALTIRSLFADARPVSQFADDDTAPRAVGPPRAHPVGWEERVLTCRWAIAEVSRISASDNGRLGPAPGSCIAVIARLVHVGLDVRGHVGGNFAAS